MSEVAHKGASDFAPGEPAQVIAVTSGKGGAGKTTVAINLATALANRGHQVMLLNGHAGLADVEEALGLHPMYDLADVLRGEQELRDILLDGPSGLSVVPTAAGGHGLTELGGHDNAAVITAFDQLAVAPDVLIIDTAPGIAQSVQRYAQAAGEVLIVLGPEPTALRNAYTLVQVLHTSVGVARFRVLVNRVTNETRARALFGELARRVDRDMSVALHYIGHIPEDRSVSRALGQQQPVVNLAPRSSAAQAFKQLARRTENWAPPRFHDGGLAFFVGRLIQQENNPHNNTQTRCSSHVS